MGHLAHLAAGDAFNAQTLGQFLNLPGRFTLHIGLLNDLDQGSFTALALGNKEGDVAAASHLGHHEIHRPNTGIQATRTKSTTVTGSFLALFMLVGANLAGYFRLHHPGAQPLQHAEHRIRAVHELE
ncbi:hypothetical protein SDC9_179002 [bioreactor metagenome]|uniref:Uncharacterized protein n=1 Tax=bioreactor metagenome TaxID=1076179 RepID=A0A645GXS4_9ZZZZ